MLIRLAVLWPHFFVVADRALLSPADAFLGSFVESVP